MREIDDFITVYNDYFERLKILKYSVIVMSYENEENANHHMNSLKLQNEDVQVLLAARNGQYNVFVGIFIFQKGEVLKRNVVKEEGIADSWLFLTNK